MKDLHSDLFDPRKMESSDLSLEVSSSEADFGFAFNDSNFSDRLLQIEIMGDTPDIIPDSHACTSISDWARERKRRREDIKKDNDGNLFFSLLLFWVFPILNFINFLQSCLLN